MEQQLADPWPQAGEVTRALPHRPKFVTNASDERFTTFGEALTCSAGTRGSVTWNLALQPRVGVLPERKGESLPLILERSLRKVPPGLSRVCPGVPLEHDPPEVDGHLRHQFREPAGCVIDIPSVRHL
jgi:hypothetical protein